LTPVTWRSGTSIRGDHPSRKGNKVLKRALFLSAFAALKDPASKAYYDRKIKEKKKHNQALIALARRRCDVLFAMLRDGTFYSPPGRPTAPIVPAPRPQRPRSRHQPHPAGGTSMTAAARSNAKHRSRPP